MTVLERIKKISKQRGYNLTKVNDMAHLGTNTIYSWKTKEPSYNNLKSVADVLDVPIDYLLGKTNETSLEETQNTVVFDNIKKYAKMRGMSLSEVNDKAGLKTNIIYSWKKKEPSINKIESVARVLGVTVDELLDNKETSKNEPVRIHKIRSPFEKSVQDLINTYSELDEEHQSRVSNYAKFQLLDQQQSSQPDTLAAHQADPNHIITDDEADEIAKFLDDQIDRHEKK